MEVRGNLIQQAYTFQIDNYMDATTIILTFLVFGFLTAFLANLKGYRARTWFGLGILLGPIATLIIMKQPRAPEIEPNASVPSSD